jgi:hypothetical protein
MQRSVRMRVIKLIRRHGGQRFVPKLALSILEITVAFALCILSMFP